MNYFYPYYYYVPANMMSSPGLFSRMFGRGFNMSSILNGAQRTLGLVNQAIPIIKEAAPVMRNAKTMFKVMNEFKKVNKPNNIEPAINPSNTMSDNYGPTFFQ